ncbi:MAG: hypothetical protein JWQ78_1829, partial [Sediminibacterium sp.]|nr:hypothetical protein [Sediminibacterium sp.]
MHLRHPTRNRVLHSIRGTYVGEEPDPFAGDDIGDAGDRIGMRDVYGDMRWQPEFMGIGLGDK